MNFWDTVKGCETADAIMTISRQLRKKQRTYTTPNSELQKNIKDMVDEGYTVVHIVPGENETLIVYV